MQQWSAYDRGLSTEEPCESESPTHRSESEVRTRGSCPLRIAAAWLTLDHKGDDERLKMLSTTIPRRFPAIAVLLLLSSVACSSMQTTQEPFAGAKPNVTIEILGETRPEARVVRVETILQNNCGGTAEAENQVEKSRSIAHTIEVGVGFEVNADGEVGLPGNVASVRLGAAVASELGHSYGTTEGISRSITVKAGPGTKMQHHISLQEVWELGTARVVVSGEEYTIPFSFRSDFALELVDSRDLGDCETELPATSTPNRLANTPTGTAIPPTSPTPTRNPAGGAISWQLCSPGGLESCQCEWIHTLERSTVDTIPDSWHLRNTGTDALTIRGVESYCEGGCLEGLVGYGSENTRDNATVVIPGESDGGITLWYHPGRDPQRGTEHEYRVVIYSDAKNCPEFTILVAIRYR